MEGIRHVPPGERRAVIIGGSLVGLFNAFVPRSIGWRVDVYERTPHTLNSRGGGIVLQPEVERLLSRTTCFKASRWVGCRKERINLDRSGIVLRRRDAPNGSVRNGTGEALGPWEGARIQLGNALKRHGQQIGNQSQFPDKPAAR
jgi:2-polyprenyl-6-methoxyphenol hydroxylase-like FAD-dependent oxidoreductase